MSTSTLNNFIEVNKKTKRNTNYYFMIFVLDFKELVV